MRRIALGSALAVALFATPALAADWYLHSGDRNCAAAPGLCSLMEVRITDIGDLVIAYSRPKLTLSSIGIGPGELLVSGRRFGNGQFVGTARRYKMYGTTRCSLTYQVSGYIGAGQDFVLEGPAPGFHPNRCASTGVSMENDQSVLTFTYLTTGNVAPDVSFRE